MNKYLAILFSVVVLCGTIIWLATLGPICVEFTLRLDLTPIVKKVN